MQFHMLIADEPHGVRHAVDVNYFCVKMKIVRSGRVI
jgi:hypothetical protein